MPSCPTCGGPVELVMSDGRTQRYLHAQPPPLDLDLLRYRNIEDFVRIVLARLRHRPGQSAVRVLNEELTTVRRVLFEAEDKVHVG